MLAPVWGAKDVGGVYVVTRVGALLQMWAMLRKCGIGIRLVKGVAGPVLVAIALCLALIRISDSGSFVIQLGAALVGAATFALLGLQIGFITKGDLVLTVQAWQRLLTNLSRGGPGGGAGAP